MARAAEVESRVVIVGAGFAGASLLRALPTHLRRPGETLLIDRSPEYGFVPLAHEVAAGRVHPDSVRARISPLCEGRCRFLQAEVTDIDPDNRTLRTTAGTVSYEYLVVSTGSSAHRPPEDLAPHFRLLWSVEDGLSLRAALSDAWERSPVPDEDHGLTVAIAGGGTTGVELAAEVAALFRGLTRRTGLARRPTGRVVLLERTDRLMGWLDPFFHDHAIRSLERLGVEVRLNSPVKEAGEGWIGAPEGPLPAAVRVWTAGLDISGPVSKLPGKRDPSGRLHVGPHLTLPDHPEVYVLGDAGAYTDPRRGPLPPTASVAVQQGPFAARDLGRRVHAPGRRRPGFDFFDRGYVVSLGPRDAAAVALGAKLSGPAAHALYRSILLYYLKSRAGRALTVSDWAMEGIGRLGFG